MARYGGFFRYGDGTKYGASAIDTQLWALTVDWNGDGFYEAYNEATRMVDCSITRGRRHVINTTGDGFEPMGVGMLSVLLDNADGRYDPYNAESPIYPYVRPGVAVQLKTKIPDNPVAIPVFTGRISNIQPISSHPNQVRITAVDGMQWLRDQQPQLKLQTNKAVDELLDMILTAAEWPWGKNLDVSSDTIPYFWVKDRASAADTVATLMNGCLGRFAVLADGTARFIDRYSANTPVAYITQQEIYKEIGLRQPWEVIRNVVTVAGYPRAQQATIDLWRLATVPAIGAGQTLEFWAEWEQNGNPVVSYIAPAATTDYAVNTAPNGSGTNLTASCTVNVDAWPTRAKLTITNNSASSGYITLLKVRGAALVPSPVTATAEDWASKAFYGVKTLAPDTPYLSDPSVVGVIAGLLLERLSKPQLYPTIQIERRPDLQFELDLLDVVNLAIPKLGIGRDYQLAYIEHQWMGEHGQATHTTFGFEPVWTLAQDVWRFSTEIGVTSKFGF